MFHDYTSYLPKQFLFYDYVFLSCYYYPQGTLSTRSECTSGFATMDDIMIALERITITNRDKQQRIIPHINFTCDGAITKWIVLGRWDSGGMHDWYPDLQIWRRNATNTFTKVGNTTLRIDTGSSDMTYYEYSPPIPCTEFPNRRCVRNLSAGHGKEPS